MQKLIMGRQRYREKIIYDLGIQDKRRRRIGAIVWTYKLAITLADPATRAWASSRDVTRPGEYFACYIHLAKDGGPFGASNKTRYFPNPELRAQHIRKRLKEMKKRQIKQGAK